MSLAKVKLAAFDMDGTLLNEDSHMTDATKEACALLQQQGCKLVISTGRTYLSAKRPTDNYPFDGYVCSNGATIYEQDGTLVQSVLLPIEVVMATVAELRGKKIYYELHDAESNRWMVAEDRDEIEAILEQATCHDGLSLRKFSFYHVSKSVPEKELMESVISGERPIVKVFVWHTDSDELMGVRQKLAPWEQSATFTSSSCNNFEVIASGVSKASGLAYFFDKWGITAEETVAFGDSFNDTELLSAVGYPVVMANADDSIKPLGKYTAPDHRENGVAQFIHQHLLSNK
ncbi:HAD family hydrolase [Brevibacillus ginsengisoli]|uniref:HAD family hydrolase n=1 Tax=Brevibacillus ginsengisoli TaxID=363854 RepID=UPI003CE70719